MYQNMKPIKINESMSPEIHRCHETQIFEVKCQSGSLCLKIFDILHDLSFEYRNREDAFMTLLQKFCPNYRVA